MHTVPSDPQDGMQFDWNTESLIKLGWRADRYVLGENGYEIDQSRFPEYSIRENKIICIV